MVRMPVLWPLRRFGARRFDVFFRRFAMFDTFFYYGSQGVFVVAIYDMTHEFTKESPCSQFLVRHQRDSPLSPQNAAGKDRETEVLGGRVDGTNSDVGKAHGDLTSNGAETIADDQTSF